MNYESIKEGNKKAWATNKLKNLTKKHELQIN